MAYEKTAVKSDAHPSLQLKHQTVNPQTFPGFSLGGLKKRFPYQLILETIPLDFTVVICTYNGADRIPDVLECLRWQLNTNHLKWEIIVVDNNSQDHTADVVRQYQKDWSYPYTIRYTFEPQQGLAHARQKALDIARSPWIGFLDDDNLPSMLWVRKAHEFAQQHPEVAAFGSRLRGLFDSEPPANFERLAAFLALTNRGNRPRRYFPADKILPPGAGLVVRRQAWLDSIPTDTTMGIRVRKRDVADDLEPLLHMQRDGWQIWYNPAMRVLHKIPASRLTRQYLASLMRGIGLSRYRTRMLSVFGWKRPWMFVAYSLNDVYKIMKHIFKYRLKVWTDTVPACEMILYFYSFISPYYFWQQKLVKLWENRLQAITKPAVTTDNQ
ncbi:MAG: glycosyltransferase family 2 protein [Leptolyngbya sp. SIO1D8]|nr:glycosyltransferase family 2 protein [Leptolyngbya sp. SIO1D8]